MGHKTSRKLLVGLSAAAAALGASAIMSSTTAPAARADDYSTIVADVQAEEALALTAFTAAGTDFASGDFNDGLTQLYIGLDDDLVGVPDELQVGTIDALTNSTLFPANDFAFSFATPANFAAGVAEAQSFYTAGNALATTIVGLPANDYADTALDNALSTFDQWIVPDQIMAIANFEALVG
jgi:hypothetical protein